MMRVFWYCLAIAFGVAIAKTIPFFTPQTSIKWVNQETRERVFIECLNHLPVDAGVLSVNKCGEQAKQIATTGKEDRVIMYKRK